MRCAECSRRSSAVEPASTQQKRAAVRVHVLRRPKVRVRRMLQAVRRMLHAATAHMSCPAQVQARPWSASKCTYTVLAAAVRSARDAHTLSCSLGVDKAEGRLAWRQSCASGSRSGLCARSADGRAQRRSTDASSASGWSNGLSSHASAPSRLMGWAEMPSSPCMQPRRVVRGGTAAAASASRPFRITTSTCSPPPTSAPLCRGMLMHGCAANKGRPAAMLSASAYCTEACAPSHAFEHSPICAIALSAAHRMCASVIQSAARDASSGSSASSAPAPAGNSATR